MPEIGAAEIEGVTDVLRSGWLTTGARTRCFEREFARAVGARHAVAVNSCTAALHLALDAAGVRPGDRVVTTPFTFAATAEVVRYFDATPVFTDIDPISLNIDPARLDAVLPGARALIVVHIAGGACDLDAIHALARQHDVTVVEDAAHALPATCRGRTIGSLSPFTCFSFYATKPLATGEGGMLCTEDDDAVDRVRAMSLHGISRHAWSRYAVDGDWRYEIEAPGFKYNLTDIAAAIGLAQLGKLHRMHRRRMEIARQYDAAFAAMPELEVPYRPSDDQHAWHLYLLRLHLERLTVDRARFIDELKCRNIGASVHFIPLHLHPYYRQRYGFTRESFPIATREYERTVSLPIYSRMTDDDVADVIAAIHEIVTANHR
jgi:dTDP-4-amino-4,6-dideoxygalactose transaminase